MHIEAQYAKSWYLHTRTHAHTHARTHASTRARTVALSIVPADASVPQFPPFLEQSLARKFRALPAKQAAAPSLAACAAAAQHVHSTNGESNASLPPSTQKPQT